MSIRTRRAFPVMLISALSIGVFTPLTWAATPSDQTAPARESPPSKPMMKKEPMMGEMKKDGMMKEDVGKAARQWDEKMKEMMEKEKKK